MNITSLLPFNLLRKIAGVNPLIVNYHVVSDEKLPHIVNLYKYRNIRTFVEDLKFIAGNFHPIGLPEFLESIQGKVALPKKSILLTFDDGFREIYDIIAPILIEYKLTATVFLTKNFLDNVELGLDSKKSLLIEALLNQSNQVKEEIQRVLLVQSITGNDLNHSVLNIPYIKRQLVDEIAHLLQIDFTGFLSNRRPYLTTPQVVNLLNEGITVGGHSIDHAKFSELSHEEQINQAVSSVEFICEKFNLNYKVFAFPYTDNAVSRHFFNSVSDKLDATFGTQGLQRDCILSNFQRISVEKLKYPASETIKYQYTRKIINRLLKRDIINRHEN